MRFFPTAEGYVSVNNGKFNYVYNYTDHLGNVRLSFLKDPEKGVLSVLEENNYYPFGLKHENYNSQKYKLAQSADGVSIVLQPTERNIYQYKYLGQERQDELGLNLDSFRYRNYDYATARFISIDPLAEDYMSITQYQTAHNNPVWKIEIEGLEGTPSNGKRDIVNNEPSAVEKGLTWTSDFLVSAYREIAGSGSGFISTVAPRELVQSQVDNIVGPKRVEQIAVVVNAAINDPGGFLADLAESVVQPVFDLASGDATRMGAGVVAIAPMFITPVAGEESVIESVAAKAEARAAKATELPKPGKGRGTVEPGARDTKRVYSQKQKTKLLANQDGKCASCGEVKKLEEVAGHHKIRHADGGKTTMENGAAVCKDCHKKIHK